MTTPLFNGTLAQIADQCHIVMLISASGTDVFTGAQIFNGTPAQIADNCGKTISVNANGAIME